jgi:hypothetical protein
MLESSIEDRDHSEFIRGLYADVLRREPDEEGFRFWERYEPRSNLVAAFMVEAQKELAAA